MIPRLQSRFAAFLRFVQSITYISFRKWRFFISYIIKACLMSRPGSPLLDVMWGCFCGKALVPNLKSCFDWQSIAMTSVWCFAFSEQRKAILRSAHHTQLCRSDEPKRNSLKYNVWHHPHRCVFPWVQVVDVCPFVSCKAIVFETRSLIRVWTERIFNGWLTTMIRSLILYILKVGDCSPLYKQQRKTTLPARKPGKQFFRSTVATDAGFLVPRIC